LQRQSGQWSRPSKAKVSKAVKWTIGILLVVVIIVMIIGNWDVAKWILGGLGLGGAEYGRRKVIKAKIKKRDKQMEDELNEVDKPASFADRIRNRNDRSN